jgi:hypothetical protein
MTEFPRKLKIRSVGNSCSITDTSVLYNADYENASENREKTEISAMGYAVVKIQVKTGKKRRFQRWDMRLRKCKKKSG